MPYFDGQYERSWNELVRLADAKNCGEVGRLMRFESRLSCIVVAGSGMPSDPGCSLKRGDIVVLFRNDAPESMHVSLEFICESVNDVFAVTSNKERVDLRTGFLVPPALQEPAKRGFKQFLTSITATSFDPDFRPFVGVIVDTNGNTIGDNSRCGVEVRCVCHEGVHVKPIKKLGKPPYIKLDKYKNAQVAFAAVRSCE